ncbi:cytochrome B561, N terminal-domain-containing protein [Powellomyces hirtus]|nr:cytochrome B561, N terminal-domain-containing protein [Powellomyces hirtus]
MYSYGGSQHAPSPLGSFHTRSHESSSSPRRSPVVPSSSPSTPFASSSNPSTPARGNLWTPASQRKGYEHLRDSPRGSPSPSWGRTSNGYSRADSNDLGYGSMSRSLSTPRRRETPNEMALPDNMAAAAAESPNSDSLSALPHTPLRWEHPAMSELDAGGLGFILPGRRIQLVAPIHILAVVAEFHTHSIYLLITALNILHLTIKYFKPAPTFTDYALTPSQRLLLGLDPTAATAENEPRKYAKVKKPEFQTRESPKSSPSIQTERYTGKSPLYKTPQRQDRTPRSFVSSPVSPLAKYMLSTSPAHMHSEPIRDRMALEKMLGKSNQGQKDDRDIRQQDDSAGYVGYDSSNSPALSAYSPSPAVPRFQRSSKASTPLKKQERIEDGLVIKEPQKTQEEWKITNYIDEWTENMRGWLSAKVVKPLARRILASDEKFLASGLEHLRCGSATMEAGMMAANMAAMAAITASTTQTTTTAFGASSFGQQASSNSLFGAKPATSMFAASTPQTNQKPQTLYELSQRHKNEALVQERLKLENYLTLPEYKYRDYIVERIKMLAKGNNLANFQWNGGAKWDGQPWSEDSLPTDAQLVMHLFCRYLDELMPGENFATYGNFPYSSKYLIPLRQKPTPARSVQIRQYTKWPPHYHVVVEGIVYDVFPGRNNVFHTLCLFAFYTKVEAAGYIGNLHVGGKAIELTSTVQGGPTSGRFGDLNRRRGGPRNQDTEINTQKESISRKPANLRSQFFGSSFG